MAADENTVLPEDTIKPSTLRNMRQAHTDISDSEFEGLLQEAVDSGEPYPPEKMIGLGKI